MTEAAVDVITKLKIDIDLKPPTLYSVVYFNDETTSFEFVARSLIDIFGFSLDAALALTKMISEKGQGVAANGLAKELASHLRDLVIMRAQAEGFPLDVQIEEE
jgi:ATP-dependent Clp protease adapter protein ClpS